MVGAKMKKDILQMGIIISTDTGSVLRPVALKVRTSQTIRLETSPQSPFKYFTDAIIGLCYHKMTEFKQLEPVLAHFTQNAYLTLNPYIELFRKSAPRVQSITKVKPEHRIQIENFEIKMTDLWQTLFLNDSLDLTKSLQILDLISDFETQIASPLLYNFSIHFNENFKEKLISFYSLLFHLRSVIAIDYNAYVDDSSIETIKCDSISDYLPKSDYTANDALLFWHFKKLSIPFVSHKDKDIRVEKLFIQPLEKYFNQYSHNACCLIEQLPWTFLNSLSHSELEETLHHVQMDWLLGSASGLLFKIREELFGLMEGYDKVFWPETLSLKAKPCSQLKLNFEITKQDLITEPSAA